MYWVYMFCELLPFAATAPFAIAIGLTEPQMVAMFLFVFVVRCWDRILTPTRIAIDKLNK